MVCIVGDVLDELGFLLVVGMINVLLEDVVIVMVSVYVDVVFFDSVEDEVRLFGVEFVEVFLNYVVVI